MFVVRGFLDARLMIWEAAQIYIVRMKRKAGLFFLVRHVTSTSPAGHVISHVVTDFID